MMIYFETDYYQAVYESEKERFWVFSDFTGKLEEVVTMNETLKEVYRMIYNLDTGEYEGLRICLIKNEKLEEFRSLMDGEMNG